MPFNRATRQNFLPAPVATYTAGQTAYSILPKVGLIKRILCLFTGTLTPSGAGTVLGVEAPWNIISRIRLTANGNTALFDTSGYGAMIASLFSAHGFSGYGSRPIIPDSATVPGPAATNASAANYAAGVASGANTWNFALEIPLALSDDWRDPIGLILAAAPDTVLQLEVTWNATLMGTAAARGTPVSHATNTATLTATLTPLVEFFTIPASQADYPDLRRIHTWTESGPQTISAVGDQDVVVQRGNTVQRLVHLVWTNTAADGSNVSSRQLRFNSNEIPYQVARQGDLVLARKRYVRDLPDGAYAWDLWNTGTPRDAINTLNLNEITSRLTIGSGATIAGTSDIRTLTEQLIQLTGAASGSA
jgi:hypothetical protein